MKKNLFILIFLSALMVLSSCGKTDPEPTEPDTGGYYYHNFLGYSVMNNYYLWNKEIEKDLSAWAKEDVRKVDPIEKVRKLRYKKGGKEYDRWTLLTDNFESLLGGIDGITTTYGFDFNIYWYDSEKKNICAVVTVVYEDSPAMEAGLRRGDIITKVKGRSLTVENYASVLNTDLLKAPRTELSLDSGKTVSMTAVKMYENPILAAKTFDIGVKKVGYLMYNSFNLRSIEQLAKECRTFRDEGVSELILDLRYNGGGYVIAEQALAAMLAPRSSVISEELLSIEVWNDNLTEAFTEKYGPDAFKSFFSPIAQYEDEGVKKTVSTIDANLDLKKIYAIITRESASASESILVGLAPYLDIEIIGEQTYGKFCGGNLISSEEWAEMLTDKAEADKFAQATRNWGIYVMVSTYYDRDGNNPCIPDGLTPKIQATDLPMTGHQFGDPEEPMLKTALQRAGKVYTSTSSVKDTRPAERFETQIAKPGFGMMIAGRNVTDIR